jgi:GldM C-terminal domain
MKRLLFICTTLLLFATCFCQDASMTPLDGNILLLDIPATFTITAYRYPCSSLYASTTNGVIKKEKCYITITPNIIGRARVSINIKTKGKFRKIADIYYWVKEPEPIFKVGAGNQETISRVALASQDYVRADVENISCSYLYPCSIDSFTVTVISDSLSILKKVCIKNKLDDEVKQRFSRLNPGDIVLFSDIVMTDILQKRKVIKPLVLKITN